MVPEVTDRRLLERDVQAGEESAFAALVARHGPRVLGICRRILANEQDAEDIFQAAFVVLARKAVLLDWEESIQTWLNAVAARLAYKARAAASRQRRRRLVPDDLPELPDPHPGPAAESARCEILHLLWAELGHLPEKYRAPVVLCYLEGKSNAEAARQLGWPAGSMSRRLARARTLLRHRLTSGLALAVALLLVAAAWNILGRRPAETSMDRPAVRQQMARLATPTSDGAEADLRRLAAGQELASPAALVHLADTAAEVAGQVRSHRPVGDRLRWRTYADEMQSSATAPASALRRPDREASRHAACRLQATCQHCHAAFGP
jgi:RNA polymerase sigma-70 factor (ECF subfamily)